MNERDSETLLRHAGFLRALARALLADEHGADDAVQDTWVRALERPPRDARRSRSWLARVLRNVIVDRRRSDAARARRDRAMVPPGGGGDAAADAVARDEMQRRVAHTVAAHDEP
jgi:DNA-directed RNA polymerase specialized sigma24 family protein